MALFFIPWWSKGLGDCFFSLAGERASHLQLFLFENAFFASGTFMAAVPLGGRTSWRPYLLAAYLLAASTFFADGPLGGRTTVLAAEAAL